MSGSLSPYALPAPAITDAAQPPSMADAWQANIQALGNWINQQRAKSAAMGLWNDQTGMPTQQALAQMGPNAALGMMGTIRAYHGSPYDFNAFDMSKIGSGEGNQAYGHGMYFAGNPAVAETYKGVQGAASSDPMANIASKTVAAGHDASNILRQIFPSASEEEISAAIQRGQEPTKGKMYEVNINADPQQLLDWDKPLSEQPQSVQDALSKIGVTVRNPATGADAYNAVSSRKFMAARGQQALDMARANQIRDPADASQTLRDAGVPGIQYLDQGSRAAGEGTRNYVMFDPSLVQIVRKYLAPLLAPVAASPFISQQQSQ